MTQPTQILEGADELLRLPEPLPPGGVLCADHPLTVDEFYDLVNEDTNAELVEGVIVVKSPASDPHEALFSFLMVVIGAYVNERGLGEIRGSRTSVRISEHTSREPDMIFIQSARKSIIYRNEVVGAPDLVIEIVSPYDEPREVIGKQANYEEIGVREFWLIDQPKKQLSVFLLGEDQRFHKQPSDPTGILRSTVISGLWLSEEWLWREPGKFPSTFRIVTELLGQSF